MINDLLWVSIFAGSRVAVVGTNQVGHLVRQTTLSQNNQNFRRKTKPVIVGAVSTVYVWFMCQLCVNAWHALVPPSVATGSVFMRRFRGYCRDPLNRLIIFIFLLTIYLAGSCLQWCLHFVPTVRGQMIKSFTTTHVTPWIKFIQADRATQFNGFLCNVFTMCYKKVSLYELLTVSWAPASASVWTSQLRWGNRSLLIMYWH